nr:DUF2235 domain-containing protein [Herbaspirillum sp. Sphag1AN]
MLTTKEEERRLADLLREPPIYKPNGQRMPSCQSMVKIGLFFDGTNNNRDRDEPLNGHTNIVKLFKAHKDARRLNKLKDIDSYCFYVPGVGTRFPENQEWSESQDGKAMGKGGQARILFGILQVYNAVHRAFNDNRPLYEPDQITAKLKSYTRDVEHNYDKDYPEQVRRQQWFTQLRDELNDRLQTARDLIRQPHIPLIRVAVFGFSRGAIQARSFCYWLDAALGGKNTLAGMPIEINFLGLFDSVASVGLAHSAAKTTPLFFADGHFSWAAETLKPLPSLVKQTVHYIAAHEQRMNFPVTRVKGQNVVEVPYPGVHSDVGGGYCPGTQGRGMRMDQMICQVPLLHMHKAARLAGVPLVTYRQMSSDLQADYALSPELATNWNAYMHSGEFTGTYEDQIREHMRLYYRFRYRWIGRMAQLPACQRATRQEQQDMISYDRLFKGDMQLLTERANGGRPWQRDDNNQIVALHRVGNEHLANQLQLLRSDLRATPDDWEMMVLHEFEHQNGRLRLEEIALLEEQVHDSLAGFYLAGYQTAQEKAEQLREWQSAPPSPNEHYRYQAWQNFQSAKADNPALQDVLDSKAAAAKQAQSARVTGRMDQVDFYQRRIVFTDEEANLLTQDAHGQPIFPLLKDSDARELRSSLITTQTMTLREGGGYLVPRHAFSP